ncbi:hypothetical protein TH53_13995 [Pedobacter lusitanus]|uniref:DUF2024 domain-containing protein n=1 Tax=Pedobacter lusitanus TaxID=1503925 RepID=A0A0D0FW12_9SPHI|nr:DUF2024 family protein [Pedobacter lusitanus]KIO76659.1 hypothetical protein TH53_13995 [Pedobacter lusitanus]
MKAAVWDTYVKKKNGEIMHFDIIAPDHINDTALIFRYGKDYLETKGERGQELSTKECKFCHIENLAPAQEELIKRDGFFIIEMEGCNP